MPRLELINFADLLGVPVEEMPADCRMLIDSFDFDYTVLNEHNRDEVILDAVKALASPLPVSGPERIDAWERGWAENLHQFVDSNFDPSSLLPYYNRSSSRVMRLQGEYIKPQNLEFEATFLEVLKRWLARRFFADVDHVYEFGCGPAHNLLLFAQIYPDKCYHGLDWATASQRIIQIAGNLNSAKITGHWFDMFVPNSAFQIEPNSAVITLDSMEQLGGKYRPFLDYLLAQSPRRCIHIEPLYELYDQSNLPDYLAAQYSERRDYLRGFLTTLKELEKSSRIVINDVRKILGSRYHDGWSLVTWTPA